MKKNSFREKVYLVAQKIPKGKVATYGQIATMAGSTHAARAVGMCMKTNPDMGKIPCHRVVAANGALTGYAFGKGISTKKQKLIKEGVMFTKDRVNLALSQWKV